MTFLPGAPSFKWSLMDEVWIPEDLEPGAYTLSFRSSILVHSAPDNLRTRIVVFVQQCLLTVLHSPMITPDKSWVNNPGVA